MTNRQSQIEILRALANKKYGTGTIVMEGCKNPTPGPRLTTGSLSLDFALGGGLKVGHIALFRGSEASGKTTTALRIAGLAQGLCANCYRRPAGGVTVEERTNPETGEVYGVGIAECDCVRAGLHVPRKGEGEDVAEFKDRCQRYKENSYEEFRVALIDAEGRFDDSWAIRLGCDPSRLVKVNAGCAEEIVDLHDELIRTGSIDLIIIDSIASMTPKDEIEKSAMEWQQGLGARIANKMGRKVQTSNRVIYRDTGRLMTGIWINQERKKIGVVFGDDTVLPGGNGQLFTASLIVKMWSSQWGKETIDADMKKEWQMEGGTDVRLNFKVIKNSTSRPMVQGGYRMGVAGSNAGEILDIDYMMAQAEKFGLLAKDGAQWRLGDEKYKTKGEMIKRIEEPAVRRALRATLVQRMLAV